MGDLIGGVVSPVRAAAMLWPACLVLVLDIFSAARRSAVPLACLAMPATASPLRFSMVRGPCSRAWPRAGGLAVEPAIGIVCGGMGVVFWVWP